MNTVFAIVLSFTSWDTCQDWAHDNDIYDVTAAEAICFAMEMPSDPPVPSLGGTKGTPADPVKSMTYSLRPKMRPEGLGNE